MRKRVSFLAVVLVVIVLGGCATFRGVGQDFESLGKGINKQMSGR